ncbi:MarR family winged helix-turn-helix transcriptional regulator [Pedobacter montanisoli]|uniref:MarR family transcriptional regulator n=1 Tax=Pedobacter montanisoli TaxID=2923277 RepID=A0ABS9ZT91_9SPHI|nr:MarR family transcriptional regulator [Pedobacter montanisoli]MCJ0741820.1 MarR family transcriptional regulator [Pedobacter montanisoli]
MEKLNNTLLYTLDKCFRTYNQFSQKNVSKAGYNITIDQWLILKSLSEESSLTQSDMSRVLFKDAASITRIVFLLEKKGYIKRKVNPADRRKALLQLTEAGLKITVDVNEVALKNRAKALKGISLEKINEMRNLLHQIMENCKS